ncbi:MAG: amidohydrolase family protein [Thermogutta sp.]
MRISKNLSRREFLDCISSSWFWMAPGRKAFAHLALKEMMFFHRPGRLVDTHVYLFPWPFRRVAHDEPGRLAEYLQASGLSAAWVSSLEALFHKDVAAVNGRLWEVCEKIHSGFLVPCGMVNPMVPHWEKDLDQCLHEYKMPTIRLFPGYHAYNLDHPEVGRLLQLAADANLGVQIVVEMEDVRGQNPLLAVKPVNVVPLLDWLRDLSTLRVMLLNCHRSVSLQCLEKLMASGRVYVDLGMLEGMAALERLLTTIPAERICFGSFTPIFYLESALLKLVESRLDASRIEAICFRNSEEFLAGSLKTGN